MRQIAAYDPYADWYEEFRDPRNEYGQRVSDVIRDLLGPGGGTCLDVCCGGGASAAPVRELGWTPLGVDLSSGQLRYAASRLPVVRADAAALPLPGASVEAAICVLAHTDVPDYAAALREVARVLRPGGRFVHVGVHPCFIGVHADRRDLEQVKIDERYASRTRSFDGWMPEGVVVRVGAWHMPLAPLLNAVLDAGFRIVRTVETGPAIPSEFSLLAIKPPEAGLSHDGFKPDEVTASGSPSRSFVWMGQRVWMGQSAGWMWRRRGRVLCRRG
jgi:SAM-dependent methyltransferase